MTANKMSSSPLNRQFKDDKSSSIQGFTFTRLSSKALSKWIGLALCSPTRSTLVFMDAETLDKCVADPSVVQFMKRSAVIIPKGRGLNLSINLLNEKAKKEIDQDALFDETLSELERRGTATCLIVEHPEQETQLVRLIQIRYPQLKLSTVEVSKERLANESVAIYEEINKTGAGCLVSALSSPLQESFFAQLNRRIDLNLRIGLGSSLGASLDAQHQNSSITKGLIRQCSSLLLTPINTLRYLSSFLGLRSAKKRFGSAHQLNAALTRSPMRIRLMRLSLRGKSQLWQFRCNMQRVFKRVTDFIGAGLGLLILSPLLLAVMLIIKASSPGSIFYSQIRVGLKGKTFRMWKFRSMYIDADARKAALEAQNEVAGGVIFKMKNDPRITPIGRIIRRLSIDELPQLFNVLKGDMSLVGPRPALESEVVQYPVLARARLEAIPGLTGLWQISGRSDLPFDKQILLDTTYVHTQSAVNDLKLIAKTIPAVISGKGAY